MGKVLVLTFPAGRLSDMEAESIRDQAQDAMPGVTVLIVEGATSAVLVNVPDEVTVNLTSTLAEVHGDVRPG